MRINQEKDLKTFGLMMGGVLSLFAGVMVYKEVFPAVWILAAAALGFVLLALAAPARLEGIHRRWMKFAHIVGKFNTNVILGIVYMVLFSMVRALLFIFRKDPLKRSFEAGRASYWEDRPPAGTDPNRFEQPY